MGLRLVLATHNEKKKRELLQILENTGVEVITLQEYPGAPEVEEDGLTFRENAIKKAAAIGEYTGCIAMADDSGLEVDYLGGQPGVFSARFAGEPSDDEKNNQKLLNMLEGVPLPERGARFRCAIAIVFPGGRTETVEDVCEGHIGTEPKGQGGFGYDPLFFPEGFEQSFGEMPPEVKHRISHRGKALQKASALLRNI